MLIAEGEPGEVNPRVPHATSRAWSKRTATILAKAEALLGDMLKVVGPNDPLTDFADNIVSAAEDIESLLERGREVARIISREGWSK